MNVYTSLTSEKICVVAMIYKIKLNDIKRIGSNSKEKK